MDVEIVNDTISSLQLNNNNVNLNIIDNINGIMLKMVL